MSRRLIRWVPLLACLVLLVTTPAKAAIAFVQQNTTVGNPMQSTISVTITPTAGNAFVVWLNWVADAGAFTISDGSSTYTQVARLNDTAISLTTSIVWVATNVTAGAKTITVTAPLADSNDHLAVHEYSGMNNATPQDVSGTNSGSGTPATATITTTVANDMVVGFTWDSQPPITTDAAFTERFNVASGATQGASGDKTQVTAGAVTKSDTVTGGGGNSWAVILASFQPAAAAAGAGGFKKRRKLQTLGIP